MKNPWLKGLLFRLILVVLVIGLLTGLDAVLGRFYEPLTTEAGRNAVALLQGDESVKKTGRFVQHPYLYYASLPGFAAFHRIQINSSGHRGREVPLEKPARTFRIMSLGGSTTISFPYVPDPEKTWTAQAARLLEQETGVHVDYVNAGFHGANSADILAHYVFRDRFFHADAVILHMGGNDGYALHFPDYNPEYTHYTHGWRNTSLSARPHERKWLRCNTLKILYAHWLSHLDLDGELGRDGIDKYSPKEAMRFVAQNEPVGFERNLDFLVRNIQQDGGTPVLFPFIYAPEEHPQKGFFGGYYHSLRLSYEKNALVMNRIADKFGLKRIDIPDGTIPVSDFVDFCHVNIQGETVKAQYVAAALKPLVEAWRDRDAGGRQVVPAAAHDRDQGESRSD